MSPTKNYYKSPLYYPDDKDIKDFLSATPYSTRKLRKFLIKRGFFVPKNISEEDLHGRISKLIYGWDDLVELVDLIDLEEKKERTAFEDIEFKGEFSLVKDAFDQVKDGRQKAEKENYKIVEKGGRLEVNVDYIEIDNSKTPMLQGRPATLKVVIHKASNGIRIVHSSNEKAEEIIMRFLGHLGELNKDEDGKFLELTRSKISLRSIINPRLRVDFFNELCRNIEGFEYEAATNVSVARIPPSLKIENECDTEDMSDSKAQEREKILKNAILKGTNVEESSYYKNLLQEGFFISALTWESIEAISKDRISFTAGFKNPEAGDRFDFKVNYRILYDEGEYIHKNKIELATASLFQQRMCTSALSALQLIKDKAETEDKKPSKAD